MQEIEIKSYLRDKQSVVSKLEKLGCVLSAPVKQIDTVYIKIIGNLENFIKKDELVKIEHETEVKNVSELEQCLFVMGYKFSNRVIKTRISTHLKDYEICLDDVEELGSFIEVEKMTDNNFLDEQIILDELNSFMFSLGVPSSDGINKGYDIMMVEKMYK